MNTPAPQFLIERARQYLRRHRGRVPEDALVGHVFGQRGRTDLWRALLRSTLATADDLVWRDDGTWSLRPAPIASPTNYAVLDIETTGLDPHRQRVIEIAVHRYVDGQRVGRWVTPINPERRVAAYIRQLTGLSHVTLAEAPRFAEVVEALLAELGDGYLIGHNIDFDLAFLNAELARLARPPITNPTLDTLRLAVALLPGLQRPNLDAVAAALGVMVPRRHRADADATITAACFARLLERLPADDQLPAERSARPVGAAPTTDRPATATDIQPSQPTAPPTWTTLQALLARPIAEPAAMPAAGDEAQSAAPATASSAGVARGRDRLDRRWLAGLPQRPGVYLLRDAADQVIYVGKAKNLNRRVRSYYSQPLGLTRKMDGLLEAISRIEVEVLGSELEALLRESRLIKELLPRYNIQQRYYQHYPFIRIDRQLPYPRIVATRSVTNDGARYFGPFRNAQAVTTTIELLTDLFPVRTCTNKISRPEQRWRACLRLDLGQCLGPCVGQTDVVTYQRLIDDIIAYLDGRREPLVERLWQQLRQASDRLDFERAARLRDAIGHVSQVTIGQHLLTAAVAGSHYLIVQPSAIEAARELLLIVAGRLACQLTLPASADHQPIAAHLYTAWQTASAAHQPDRPVDQASLDEIAIISRWLAQHHGSPAILDLPQPADDSAGWQRLIADLPPLAALAPAGRSPRAAPVAPELIDRFYEES